MKKRHYLKLYKRSGEEFIGEMSSWEKFTDAAIEDLLKLYKADYAIKEERFSLN